MTQWTDEYGRSAHLLLLSKHKFLTCGRNKKHGRECDIESSNVCLTCHYTKSEGRGKTLDMKDLFIVRHEYYHMDGAERPQTICQAFLAFANFAAFAQYRDSIAIENRCFHEIVFKDSPQKLKFDIDNADITISPHAIESVKRVIIRIIRTTFLQLYGDMMGIGSCPNTIDIVRCYSTNNGSKLNEHIIISNFYVQNAQDASLFYKQFLYNINALAPTAEKYIDKQVNKSTQNLRLIGSIKLGKPGTLKCLHPSSSNYTDADTVISARHGTPAYALLNTACVTKKYSAMEQNNATDVLLSHKYVPGHTVIDDDDIDTSEKLDASMDEDTKRLIMQCNQLIKKQGESNAHIFSNIKRMSADVLLINYTRMAPSYCESCKRVHDSDNTLYFVARGINLYQKCRHFAMS